MNFGSFQYYEALRASVDRTPINTGALGAVRTMMATLNRNQLASLARWLYDNYGRVSYAVDTVANYSAPVAGRSASLNPAWNKTFDEYFNDWTDRAEFTGRFNLNMVQRLNSIAADVEGDQGCSMTLENGFPQVQIFECWRIRSKSGSDPMTQDGVQIDAKGRLLGYWVDEKDFYNRNQFFLFYDPFRFCNYRGISPLRRGMNDIRDVSDIKGFEKLATKLWSALAAVIEGGPIEENVWGNDTGTDGNLTSDKLNAQEKKFSMAELMGGDIPVLPSGQSLKPINSGRPSSNIVDILLFLIAEFVCSLGIPPAFFLDERLTGPNTRGVNGKAQRRFDNRQEVEAAFLKWVRTRVAAWAIAVGDIPYQDGWDKMEWNGPAEVSIDEGADAANDRADVACGLKTRTGVYGKSGLNFHRETDRGIEEDRYIIAECRKLATETGVPLSTLLVRYGFTPLPPAPNETKPNEPQTPPQEGPKP
jgi:capsid protein